MSARKQNQKKNVSAQKILQKEVIQQEDYLLEDDNLTTPKKPQNITNNNTINDNQSTQKRPNNIQKKPIQSQLQIHAQLARKANYQARLKQWTKYLDITSTPDGAISLEEDQVFFEKLTTILHTKNLKNQKDLIYLALQTFTSFLTNGKNITCQFSYQFHQDLIQIFCEILQNLSMNQKQIAVISLMVKLFGLLKDYQIYQQKQIQQLYLYEFLPAYQILRLIIIKNNTIKQPYNSLTINMIKTLKIFALHAYTHHDRQIKFFKNLQKQNQISQFIISTINLYKNDQQINCLILQLIDILLQPMSYILTTNPWRQYQLSFKQHNQFQYNVSQIRSAIVNRKQYIKWIKFQAALLRSHYQSDQKKILILNVILQSIKYMDSDIRRLLIRQERQERQFTQLLKDIVNMVNQEKPRIFAVGCLIITQLLKNQDKSEYIQQNKKGKSNRPLYQYLQNTFTTPLINRLQKQSRDLLSTTTNNLNLTQQYKQKIYIVRYAIFSVIQQIFNQPKMNILQLQLCQCLIKQHSINYMLSCLNQNQIQIQNMSQIIYINYPLNYYDPILACINQLIVNIKEYQLKKQQKQQKYNAIHQILKKLQSAGLYDKLISLLLDKQSNIHIYKSAQGLKQYIQLINKILQLQYQIYGEIPQQFMQADYIIALIHILRPYQYQCMMDMPEIFGGGQASMKRMFGLLVGMFGNYLNYVLTKQHKQNKQSKQNQYNKYNKEYILQIYHAQELFDLLIKFTNELYEDEHQNSERIINLIQFIQEVINCNIQTSTYFIDQFRQFGGLELYNKYNLLDISKLEYFQPNNTAVLSPWYLLVQLSERFEQQEQIFAIQKILQFQNISILLQHQNRQVKELGCELVQNLLRNSSVFVEQIKKYDILTYLLDLCTENEHQYTREYAIRAIEAAVNHKVVFKNELGQAIHVLVSLLEDKDARIRLKSAQILFRLTEGFNQFEKQLLGYIQIIMKIFQIEKYLEIKTNIINIIYNMLDFEESRKLIRKFGLKRLLSNYLRPSPKLGQQIVHAAQRTMKKLYAY